MTSNAFSLRDFFDPDSSFYPVYSWMWNERLHKDEIKRQLDTMYERNIRGTYVIPLPAEFRPDTMATDLQPPYLSDGYFEMLSFAADYASSKGMTLWLYDEGGWPSGNANGLVTKDSKNLRLTHIEGGKIRKSRKADLTDLTATEKFISLTHERHREKMGDSFTSLGPLVFTDEPSISALPFTESIKAEYRRRTGKRLSARRVKKHNDPLFNITYHDICADLFAENYFAPIRKWCRSKGLLSAGHLDKDNEALGFLKSCHHPLRPLRMLDVPGVDVIWGQISPHKYSGFFPRLASSAAEQTGSGLSLTESLSVYGTVTYEQMRYILGYQLVRGINILNFMLLMYDEKGCYALRQRPSFSSRLPCGEYLPAFNRYMASLQYLMQRGRPDTRCALYLPVRSLWAQDEDTEAALKKYEEAGREIERHHGQFDIIDDDLILGCDDEKLKTGIISMGRAEYRVLYIPADKYMTQQVKNRLGIFTEGGGRLYPTDNAEYFPMLDISGDKGQLRVHKKKCDGCDLYLVFNEGADRVNAQLRLPEGTKELDALNKKVYSVREHYSLESGEIKVFVTVKNNLADKEAPEKGRKICTLTDFKVRQIKKFTLDSSGMNYTDAEGCEKASVCGDWSALYGSDFSGKCEYRGSFTLGGEPEDVILSLGRVCYGCEVTLNGVKAAELIMPPYEAVIGKELLRKENELIITVSNTAANAFVHFDLPKEWEKKHIGPYHEKALGFERALLHGGLYGPVEIYEKENGNE